MMGDTLSRMADMEGRHPSGRPLDAPHTRLVAQDVPGRLERIAVQFAAAMLARESSVNAGEHVMGRAVRHAKRMIAILDEEGTSDDCPRCGNTGKTRDREGCAVPCEDCND